jgi:quercetin dioxygenase-like cupin family protein
MIELKQIRRSFLLGLAGLGISQTLPQGQTAAQAATPQGYVLGPDGGDHLVHFRNPGNIFIKVDPVKGSPNLALGTQQVPVGAGIPIHRHFEMDEAFYILEGGGTFMLDEQPHPFEKGGTIYIPKNAWHGFANPEHELLLLWIVAPPGLDGFFRETCNPPGVPRKQLTRTRSTRLLANMRRNSADRAPSLRCHLRGLGPRCSSPAVPPDFRVLAP